MTYHLNGNNPQNLIVANQFNPESFQVVQQVYYSLDQIRLIFKHLDVLNLLGREIYRVKDLEPYIRDLGAISAHLDSLLNLEYDLPFLKEVTPRVRDFVNELTDIRTKLSTFDMNFKDVLGLLETNTKHLEDLYCQYETQLACLIETYKAEICEVHTQHKSELEGLVTEAREISNSVRSAMPIVSRALENVGKQEIVIKELVANMLVDKAKFTKEEADFKTALKAIKELEKYKVNGDYLRYKLNYKLPSQNVLKMMKMGGTQ